MARHGAQRRIAIAVRDRRLQARSPTGFDGGHSPRPCRLPRASASTWSAIAQGAPVELDLRLESVSEGVLVTGTVSAPTAGECARCLTPITGDVEIDLTELFAYPDSATEATTEDDEIGHVVDDTIDLEQPVIDAIGLVLPFAPVCEEDCPGLCPECGVRLADAEPGHQHDLIDPRWAKLAAMLPTEPNSEEPPETSGGPG